MDSEQLQSVIEHEIPVTRCMGITVLAYDGRVLSLGAPLDVNINHKSTAFGGSLATLATLAGWGLLYCLTREQGLAPQIVVVDSHIRYLQPVTTDFEARCMRPNEQTLALFFDRLTRRGRAAIVLQAGVYAGDVEGVSFEGRYLAQLPVHDKADKGTTNS